MTDPQQERFRYSLAHLMGLVLIVGIVLGALRLLVMVESIPAMVLVASGATFIILTLVFRIVSQGMTWIQICVSTGIVMFLAAYLFPAVYYARTSARIDACNGHIHNSNATP